jgi:hypothetical protein
VKVADHIALLCPNCQTETFSNQSGKHRCVTCKKDIGIYVEEVLGLAFPGLSKRDIWGTPAQQGAVIFNGKDPSFVPWLTEQERFTNFNGDIVTRHSTGQEWVTKPDGTFVSYLENTLFQDVKK